MCILTTRAHKNIMASFIEMPVESFPLEAFQ